MDEIKNPAAPSSAENMREAYKKLKERGYRHLSLYIHETRLAEVNNIASFYNTPKRFFLDRLIKTELVSLKTLRDTDFARRAKTNTINLSNTLKVIEIIAMLNPPSSDNYTLTIPAKQYESMKAEIIKSQKGLRYCDRISIRKGYILINNIRIEPVSTENQSKISNNNRRVSDNGNVQKPIEGSNDHVSGC